MTNLNEFVKWSKDNPNCKITIEIGGYDEAAAGKIDAIWVYNFKLLTGQHVSSAKEIDIESEYRKGMGQKRQEVERYFQEIGGL